VIIVQQLTWWQNPKGKSYFKSNSMIYVFSPRQIPVGALYLDQAGQTSWLTAHGRDVGISFVAALQKSGTTGTMGTTPDPLAQDRPCQYPIISDSLTYHSLRKSHKIIHGHLLAWLGASLAQPQRITSNFSQRESYGDFLAVHTSR
jgi:hypothetical protein